SKRNEIDKVVKDIKSSWDKLDGLFNNAGILTDKLYYSDYGNELQLEVNGISPYLLTKGLLPLLEKGENSFVVNTATSGLNGKKSFDISSFKKPKKFTKLLGSYIDSKLTMVLLMNHLSEEWKKIRFVSVDPGAIKTKMTAGSGMPFWLKPIRNLFFKSPKDGAENLYKEAFNKKNQRSGIYISGGNVKDMQVSIKTEELVELMK
ncbi:MAG: SDR family NAD(P)-dependent oxidoreductase, partial [Bacteroidota bacterium]